MHPWLTRCPLTMAIFGRTICTHFGTVSPLFMISINQMFSLQKTLLFIPNPNLSRIFGNSHHASIISATAYSYLRPVVPGCAGCARAHPNFGRSVNPISTRGHRLCPPNYYGHTQIFNLQTSLYLQV